MFRDYSESDKNNLFESDHNLVQFDPISQIGFNFGFDHVYLSLGRF